MHRRTFNLATAVEQAHPRRRRPWGKYRYVRLRWHVLFTVIDAIGGAIFGLVRRIGQLGANQAGGRQATAMSAPHRILLVQLDHLGDAILSTVLLRGLRRRFPAAEIEVLCGEWNSEFFHACPEVTQVHVLHSNRFARRGRGFWPAAIVRCGWQLRHRAFDLAIDPRGEFPAIVMMWLSGARRRLGWSCGGGGFLLTDRATYVEGRHEVESRRELLRAIDDLTGSDSLPIEDKPHFNPGGAARQCVAARLGPLAEDTPLVVMHIGAGSAAKRWPVENWRQLATRLTDEDGARFVFVGQAAESEIAQQILRGADWLRVDDWTGQLGVKELAALIETADVFIGADSGPAHLAAAVGTPAVVLFSGTNRAAQWRPWGDQVAVMRHAVPCSPCHLTSCHWSEHPCMQELSPAAVHAAAARHLATRRSTFMHQPTAVS